MENKEVMLSIIVPLYNASETLERCITSIQKQAELELEIICVNDGSTDNTLELCQNIHKSDSRIKIVDKKNGGVASARNKGMEVAKGRYVTFVDQDDWVEENAYSYLLSTYGDKDADMIVFKYTKDSEDGNVKEMKNELDISLEIYNRDDLIRYAFFREMYRGFAAFVWNKLFKREFLETNNIGFVTDLRRGDDVLFFSDVVVANPRTMYVDKSFYHYVQRMDSITHTKTKQNIDRLGEILLGYQRAISNLENSGISKSSTSYMKCFYAFHASNLLELAIEENLEEEKQYYKSEAKRYLSEYSSQNNDKYDRLVRMEKLLKI